MVFLFFFFFLSGLILGVFWVFVKLLLAKYIGYLVIEERKIFQWKAPQDHRSRSSNKTLQDRVIIIIIPGCFAEGLVLRAVHRVK